MSAEKSVRPAPFVSPRVLAFARLLRRPLFSNEIDDREKSLSTDDDHEEYKEGKKTRVVVDFENISKNECEPSRSRSPANFVISSTKALCENIDESMWSLHTCLRSEERLAIEGKKDTLDEYDWILDGDPLCNKHHDGLQASRSVCTSNVNSEEFSMPLKRRRKFGDEGLDEMLDMMELENPSFSTTGSSCSSRSFFEGEISNVKNTPRDPDSNPPITRCVHKGVELGGFSDFNCDNKGNSHDKNNQQEWEEFMTVDILVSEQGSNLMNAGKTPQSICPIGVDNTSHKQNEGNCPSADYIPPNSIALLVSNLDAELDVEIQDCLASTSERRSLQDADSDGLTDFENLREDSDINARPTQPAEADIREKSEAQSNFTKAKSEKNQPHLMSPMLLQFLPIPELSTSADSVGEFTRRIQTNHLSTEARHKQDYNASHGVQCNEDQIANELMKIIHSGYFCNGVDHDDSYDSIVLDEILNVPWPFHLIDINEPLFDDVSWGTNNNESFRQLNFDSYISNRLSELDTANNEIMGYIMSHLCKVEDDINDGIKTILTAELDVSAALLYAESSRFFLFRAMGGCFENVDNEFPSSNTDVISGGLAIVNQADHRHRLKCLAHTINQISFLISEEARWRDGVSSLNIMSQGRVIPEQLDKLASGAKQLMHLISEEKVFNHIFCLHETRNRINELPEILLASVDDFLESLLARLGVTGIDDFKIVEVYFSEFETLFRAYVSSVQLTVKNNDKSEPLRDVAARWSGCVLKALCVEASKALLTSINDSINNDKENSSNEKHDMKEFEARLIELSFNSKVDQMELESLAKNLIRVRVGNDSHKKLLASVFFHLCSRLVELFILYSLLLEWQEKLFVSSDETSQQEPYQRDIYDNAKSENFTQHDLSENDLEYNDSRCDTVSSISSDQPSSSSKGDTSRGECSTGCVPSCLEVKFTLGSGPTFVDFASIAHESLPSIRNAFWKYCESILVLFLEEYASSSKESALSYEANSYDRILENLSSTYSVFQQFKMISLHFLCGTTEYYDDIFNDLETNLSNIYRMHVHAVHVEAMKTTGALLRHDQWQLISLDIAVDSSVSISNGNNCSHTCSGDAIENEGKHKLVGAIYESVKNLFSTFPSTERRSDKIITSRALNRGYQHCKSFAQFLKEVSISSSKYDDSGDPSYSSKRVHYGLLSSNFASILLSFVERKPCGQLTLPLMTHSAVNGLLKWTSALLAIGNSLPLVAGNVSAAIATLFDLYILTIFRFCARNVLNEDVLIGFGRRTSSWEGKTRAPLRSKPTPTSPNLEGARRHSLNKPSQQTCYTVSLTMEADVCAPLPREKTFYKSLQQFVNSSKERIQDIVDLDRFESFNNGRREESLRSKSDIKYSATELEKQAAAAYSCLFAAVLVDVASKLLNFEEKSVVAPVRDINHEQLNFTPLEDYAAEAIKISPIFVTQLCKIACMYSISGKELIFQVMMVGRTWEEPKLKEHSNAYVDELCEKCISLLGHMTSSLALPPSALEFTWEQLICIAFASLQEGFSRIFNCSTEGRALMSMDLATLYFGLSHVTVAAKSRGRFTRRAPPPSSCEKVMRYVDTFIKVFYYPDADILEWVKKNSKDYYYEHALSLVTAKSSFGCESERVIRMSRSIEEIYSQFK